MYSTQNVGYADLHWHSILVALQNICHAVKDVPEFSAQYKRDTWFKQCYFRPKVWLLTLLAHPLVCLTYVCLLHFCLIESEFEYISSIFGRWGTSSSAMESLYDIDLISKTVPVILDNPKSWYGIVSRSTKLGEGDVAHVQGVSRDELKDNPLYSDALLINRTASPLAW
jgi:hypothetical protein